MKETDKTAIELIYEMHQMLTKMDQRLALLENQVLLLNDKANGKLFNAVQTDLPKGKDPELTLPKKTSISPDRLKQAKEAAANRQQNIRVFGKFSDQRNKPISGIDVTVLDANNRVIKTTRTNRAGEWNSFLPPGQYSVEFIKENMAPQFRAFELMQGQTEVEVM